MTESAPVCTASLARPVTRTGTGFPSMDSRSERQTPGSAAGAGAMRKPGMPSSAIAAGAATVSPVDSRVAS